MPRGSQARVQEPRCRCGSQWGLAGGCGGFPTLSGVPSLSVGMAGVPSAGAAPTSPCPGHPLRAMGQVLSEPQLLPSGAGGSSPQCPTDGVDLVLTSSSGMRGSAFPTMSWNRSWQ